MPDQGFEEARHAPTSPGDKARVIHNHIRRVTDPKIHFDRMAFLRNQVRGKSVLDLGCVEHTLTNMEREDWVHKHIVEEAASVLGMDYEESEVAALRSKGFNVVAADATNFDLGQKFEVIVAGEFLEHIQDAKGFLDSARKHLLPGGHLVLTVPNANSVNYFIQNVVFGYETDGYDHVAFYTPLTLFNLLDKCGFALTRLTYLMPDTSIHHASRRARIVVRIMRWMQLPWCFLRPSLSRQMAVIATPYEGH